MLVHYWLCNIATLANYFFITLVCTIAPTLGYLHVVNISPILVRNTLPTQRANKRIFHRYWHFIQNISNGNPIFFRHWHFIENISNVKQIFKTYFHYTGNIYIACVGDNIGLILVCY